MREKEKSQLKKRLLGLVVNEPPYPHPITMSEVMVNDMSKPNIKPLLNFIEQEIEKAREESREEVRQLLRDKKQMQKFLKENPKFYKGKKIETTGVATLTKF